MGRGRGYLSNSPRAALVNSPAHARPPYRPPPPPPTALSPPKHTHPPTSTPRKSRGRGFRREQRRRCGIAASRRPALRPSLRIRLMMEAFRPFAMSARPSVGAETVDADLPRSQKERKKRTVNPRWGTRATPGRGFGVMGDPRSPLSQSAAVRPVMPMRVRVSYFRRLNISTAGHQCGEKRGIGGNPV